MCWGVRNMHNFELLSVKSPSVEITIGDQTFQSSVIANTDRNPNFDQPLEFRDLVRVLGQVSLVYFVMEF